MEKHSPSQTNTTFIRVAKTSHKELLRRSEVNGTTIAQEVEKALGTYEYQPNIFAPAVQLAQPQS